MLNGVYGTDYKSQYCWWKLVSEGGSEYTGLGYHGSLTKRPVTINGRAEHVRSGVIYNMPYQFMEGFNGND